MSRLRAYYGLYEGVGKEELERKNERRVDSGAEHEQNLSAIELSKDSESKINKCSGTFGINRLK